MGDVSRQGRTIATRTPRRYRFPNPAACITVVILIRSLEVPALPHSAKGAPSAPEWPYGTHQMP